jgi:hypothetical protein
VTRPGRMLFVDSKIVWGALLLTACGAAPPPTAQDYEKQYVRDDTEEACAQTSAPRWSEVVFVSDKWRDIAPRADAGDPEAWREIATLMRANMKQIEESLCSDKVVAEVEASAGRLAKK